MDGNLVQVLPVPIVDCHSVEVADALDDSQPEAQGLAALLIFSKAHEKLSGICCRRPAGVADKKPVRIEIDFDTSTLHVMTDGILEEVGQQYIGQYGIDPQADARLDAMGERQVFQRCQFFKLFDGQLRDPGKIDEPGIGKFLVLNFGEQ